MVTDTKLLETGAGYSSLLILWRLKFLFVVLEEERSLQNKGGYTRRIARFRFGRRCPHKETRRSTQTNNTPSSHTSCKVHWGWRCDFWRFIV